tara:strand:- start:1766 stop:1978 length:213 start_codon:yes stop_codon:yes gene_type:complete
MIMGSSNLQGREVIFEFTQFGHIVKVTAMDTKSRTEISIQGPSSTAQSILQTNALKRLEYVLKKKGIIKA